MLPSEKLRKQFLEFFRQKRHGVLPSASLIPENDPTVLFTTAGMHPLVPFLLGEPHPSGKRLVNFQKCVRTNDIEMVGDQWHLTFFEMLGNWSLGNYFKKEAIEWSYEFLTSKKWLGLDPQRISVSCFAGDKDAPRDTESAEHWKRVGIPEERIFFFPKKGNWWGPAGAVGPCGPDTEMFFDSGKPHCKKGLGREFGKHCNPGCDCGKFVEIWNDVFMQYNKTADGKFELLEQKNVDTGMGLERIVAVLEGLNSNFETDLLKPVFDAVQKISKATGEKAVFSQRIIADHLRAAVFILGDEHGIVPSNTDQGYVLRRLIRRTVRHGKLLGIEKNFCAETGKIVLERYQGTYPELKKNRQKVLDELEKEENRFKNTLENGMHLLQKEIETAKKSGKKELEGKTVFDLYQSFGFPLEMTQEIAAESSMKVNAFDFEKRLKRHQELSKKGAEQRFSGGLADHSEEVIRLHTATHLLNAALQRVLGKHVHQQGSNITKERLRFDFPHSQKMTPEEIKKAEEWVNQKIKEDLEVKFEMLPLKEALKLGAMAEFGEKYGETVKVYSVWNPKTKEVFSRELCGGPHVKNTRELGNFKIIKEEAVAAGIRRIKAVLEEQK